MMNESAPSDSLVFECDFEEPPEKVWRALTEPQLLEGWLTAEPSRTTPAEETAAPEVAATPRRVGASQYHILSAEPHRRLRFHWRDRESAAGNPGGREVHSVVTFELVPGPTGGTHLRLTHGEFRIVAAAPPVAAAGPRPIASVRRRTTPIRLVAQSAWRRAA